MLQARRPRAPTLRARSQAALPAGAGRLLSRTRARTRDAAGSSPRAADRIPLKGRAARARSLGPDGDRGEGLWSPSRAHRNISRRRIHRDVHPKAKDRARHPSRAGREGDRHDRIGRANGHAWRRQDFRLHGGSARAHPNRRARPGRCLTDIPAELGGGRGTPEPRCPSLCAVAPFSNTAPIFARGDSRGGALLRADWVKRYGDSVLY